ncbi:hypothetical protein SAMN05421878_10132 [Actinobaculum suis]|uniref:Bacteriocin-associated integral membrane protein n=1 Tax=Actinobaculum suis TaxID=1657 RepID=A0A1G6Z9T7_9ACTO|nr:hypothetical protein [Actinobaculum suis]MDY5153857.1 hypothetical protein [Actinobaculum suis]SDD99281.1 hypothetical protein SAMN05421878_10132 [Actinobaculum suis]VDG76719.1 bacteriocin-associated integral membrane protein [Actinobaculum suis]
MHRLAKVSLVLAILYSALFSFQLLVDLDSYKPLGARSTFTVEEVSTESKAAALQALQESAATHQANIYKIAHRQDNSFEGRILFAFIGDTASFEEAGGEDYPSVVTGKHATQVRAGSEITTEDLRGTYATSLAYSSADYAALLADLETAGFRCTSQRVPTIALVLFTVSTNNSSATMAILFVLTLLTFGYGASQSRKIRALEEIHGYSTAQMLRRDVRDLSKIFALFLPPTLLVTLLALFVYNSLQQLSRYLQILVLTWAGFYVFALLACVLATITLGIRAPVAVLKGDRAGRSLAVFSTIAALGTLIIVFATTTATCNRIDAVNTLTKESAQWRANGQLYALRLTTTGNQYDDMEAAPAFQQIVAQAEQDGKVLLVAYNDYALIGEAEPPMDGYPASDPYARGGSKSLLVNGNYLDRQTVVDVSGRRLTSAVVPTETGHYLLLVPENYPGDVELLAEKYNKDFTPSHCKPELASEVTDPEPCFTLHAQVIRIPAGQTYSTYGGTKYQPADDQAATRLQDPIIAVASAASQVVPPISYISYASTDDLFFTDSQALDAALVQAGIRGNFQGIDNAADAVTTSVQLAQQALQQDLISMALALFVLVTAAIIFAEIYCDRFQKRNFLRKIHGYPFAVRHLSYLAVEIMVVLLALACSFGIAHVELSVRNCLLLAGLSGLYLLLSVSTLIAYERRFNATIIKRD